MSVRKCRSAFTLVELLVVITIIGILMGMIIPATSAVRERAHSMQCSANLHNIGLAALTYEGRVGFLPMNWGVDLDNRYSNGVSASSYSSSSYRPATPQGFGTPTNPPLSSSSNRDQSEGGQVIGHSWITMLLPDLDDNPLFQKIKFGAPANYTNAGENKDNMTAAQHVIAFLRCPSDSGLGSATNQEMIPGQLLATTNYKASCGSNWPLDVLEEDPDAAKSNSAQFSGTRVGVKSKKGRNAGRSDAPDACNGATCRNRSVPPQRMMWMTTMANITDGPSKTILYGESVPAWSAYSAWYWWNGALATCGLPLNYQKDPNNPHSRETTANDYLRCSGFMSKHSARGGNFVFGDGHTAWIANGISPDIYRALATIDGQESFSEDY